MVLVQHAPGHPVERHLGTEAGTAAASEGPRPRPAPPPGKPRAPAPHLEEVLRYAGEALRVVRDALQVRVLVQDVVVDVQEELEGVLVQEVYLGAGTTAVSTARCRGPARPGPPAAGTCFRASMVK